MSTATGTPVFVTVGGDASAATATYTPSGATTSTTIALGDLAASVASNTTAVAAAATSASAAVTTANAASSAATTASSAAATALTTANAAVPSSQILDSSGNLLAKTGAIRLNYNTGTSATTELNFYSSGGTNNDGFLTVLGGSGAADGEMWIGAKQLACYAAFPIGTATFPFSGAVLQSAVQVVSDANDKTIIGTIGTSDFTAETTKLRAAWAAISGVVYTLNFSTNATKRNHIGVIAQTVQAAFTAQGLDPSDYGLWCSTPKTKAVTSTVDGVTTTTEEPVYEADGKTQATQQTVRYEELLSLGIFCERLERSDLAARVTALEAKSTAATATTSTASTTA
ncbi:tail fiber domain-containing protein [Acetobacter thailandicus]|uniref:tail fiber domain-containing protein n=2 Tax=Acetobacter TaxID=434 RepID=UPI001BAD4339|nr:tail fiber domain-containing protein [Acetobacter thailandicus]MBS1003154.1 tail fiber domain-containing protein [Acetobacter thailandicus]